MDLMQRAKKFLCIDDDRTLLMIVKQVLTKSFRSEVLMYYEAASGEEGLQKILELKPDIILSDIQMPGISGFELCRKIREFNPHCAVILMSAYDPEEDNAIHASEAGADAYLSKPVKKGELLFVVNFVLRVANLNDALYEKNFQLEQSLDRLRSFHQKLGALNEELRSDKRRLDASLREMQELNAQLEAKNAQISAMMEEVAARFDSTVALLGNLIELRQAEHRGHSERVANMSVFIAKRMKLLEHQIQNIHVAARLHELGIVGLPGQDVEALVLDAESDHPHSNHPLVGEMLLKSFPGFEQVAEIIRHLHENVDGSGAPDGLYGDRIPIGSRIISAASYFDHAAIANPGKRREDILREMEEDGNRIFDDQVLRLMRDYLSAQQTLAEKFYECPVYGLSEGMELADDIYSESGINLLRKGTVLDRDTLAKMMRFHNVDPIVGSVKVRQK